MGFESTRLPNAAGTSATARFALAPSLACVAAFMGLGATPALAHHSYSMFDTTKSVFVKGTVAKVEWVNPHTFVWVYVEKKATPGQYDLYAFENGPITMLMRAGWTKETMKVGEKVTVQYFPLKDGRTGGSFVRAIHEDGTESIGDQFAPGVAEAAKLKPDAQ